MRICDWRGRAHKRWSWTHWRYEWGRWCYTTNAMGETLSQHWEWEAEPPKRRGTG
jgi:hypothetical protein